jgi:hypothetical protein
MKQTVDDVTATELERLELSLMDPQVRRDRNRVSALLDEDFLEFGSSGRVWTRETTLDLLSSETYSSPAMEDFSCLRLAADVVLCTYAAIRRGAQGERVTTLRSSIWTKQSGTWKLRFHQGTQTTQ